MRIAHCVWNLRVGGTETMLVDIINKQAISHAVTLFIINKHNDKQLIESVDPRVKIVYINRTEGRNLTLKYLWLNLLLWKSRFDVLHLHTPNQPKVVIGRPCKKQFLTVHALKQTLYTKYYKKLDAVFAISQSVNDDIKSRVDNSLIIVPNGINTDKIQLREDRPASQPFRIVMVGRLDSKIKGQDILIEAVNILRNELKCEVIVDFIGEGESKTSLSRLAEDLGIADSIKFLGSKGRDFIYSHLKEYDLLCHPARFEGFGLTVIEAMAANLPVLVSDAGGPFEIIKDGEYGYSFKSDDATDCASKIQKIIVEYDQTKSIAQKALAYVKQNYSLDSQVENYNHYYQGRF